MMNGDDQYLSERHGILSRLLDAVKQCQVRFGGRTELATDGDSRVSCLCAAWEAALQHGMRRNNKALSAFKQVTEMTGLSKVTGVFGDIKNLETEPTFWAYVKEHLTKHEAQRYTSLKSMVTDAGRGRAWLRASLNEHSLERYMHMLLEDTQLLSQYYEDWSFLRDQERSSMLPMMAAGLGSILFAITIDKTELNSIRQAPINIAPVATTSSTRAPQEPQPVISGEPIIEKKKEKKKKKKVATIVTFGEDDEGTYSSSPSSVKSPTVSVTDHSVSHHNFSFAQPDDGAGQDTATTSTAEPSPDKDVIQFDFSVDDSSKSEDKSDKVEEKPLVLENKLVLSVNRSDIEARAKNDSTVIGIEKDTARLTLDLETTVKEEGGIDISRSPRSSDHEPSLTSLSSVERPSSHGSFSSTADAEETDPQDVLTPVTPSGKVLNVQLSLTKEDTVSGSVDSGDLLSYAGEEVEFAAKALALAQKGFTSHGLRTEGDGGDSQDMSSTSHETMSTQELKQAVVAMMMRKDEVEEQNRLVRSMLEQEMETSSTLKAEIEELKVVNLTRQEKDMAKLHALQKENELLKHQLRKYVNAVQLLRKSEDPSEDPGVSEKLGIHLETPQPTIPPQKPHIDYSHEASEYEKKLIQVAEMHGELMEFNELLHRQLSASGRQVRQLTSELVDLRGPANHIFPPSSGHLNLPQDDITFADGEFESSQLQNRTLINIWIPSAFLRGSSTGAHHVYQVYVRIRDEEWNVYRRYNQFRDFLTFLKKKHPMVSKFDFPPKKAIGSKDAKVVEMRRRTLQVFLRNVINYMTQHDSDLSSNVSKDKLTELMPFFGDEAVTDPKSKKAKKQKPAAGGRRQSRQQAVQPQAMPAEAPPQYTGL